MLRFGKALGALIALAVLAAGVPWALVHFIGNPWPAEGVSLAAPITDGAIIGLVAALVWVLWAQLMVCVLVEVAAAFRGREATRVPGTLGFQQHLARRLVGALLLAGAVTPVIAGTATAAENLTTPMPQTMTSTVVQADTPDDPDQLERGAGGQHQEQQVALEPDEDDEPARTKTVVVQPLDSLWSIAEAELGDGDRWVEIAGLNDGRIMNTGATFTDPNQLEAGWELLVPVDAAPTGAQEAGERSVTVEPGDTLSQIALEELGDPNAYPELFEANQGQPQPGGGALSDPDLIQPGWTISIPGDTQSGNAPAADLPESAPAEATDPAPSAEEAAKTPATTSSLGDSAVGGAAPTQETEQPPAAEPTQTPTPAAEAPQGPAAAPGPAVPPVTGMPAPGIELPSSAAQPQAAEPPPAAVEKPELTPAAPVTAAPAPAPEVPAATPSAAAAPSLVDSAQTDIADPAGDQVGQHEDQASEEDETESWPTRTKGGVLALTAGALIGLVALRRQQQMRRRTPGEALPLPESDEAEEVEAELRAIADPVEVAHVDAALRSIAAVCDGIGATRPTLRLARLTEDQLEVYFAAPSRLDTPWRPTGDPTVWEMSASTLRTVTAPAQLDAPYPALVTVGDDEDGGTILINLTDVGSFGVTGDLTSEALRGYVAELGASPWAGSLAIYITGELGGIAGALGTGRIHAIDSSQIRGQAYAPGSSVLIDTAGVVDDETHAWLRANGVAVVTNGQMAGDTGVHIVGDQEAQLLPWHVTVTPQLVDDRTWTGLLEILRASQAAPTPAAEPQTLPAETAAATAAETVDESARLTPAEDPVDDQAQLEEPAEDELEELVDLEEPVDDHQVAGEVVEETPTGQEAAAAIEETPQQTEPTGVPEQQPAELRVISHPEPTQGSQQQPAGDILDTGHPVIRLLTSQVVITGTSEQGPANESHRKVCTRLAAYMALNPGAARTKLVDAVWGGARVSPATVDSRLSHLRKWLGEAATGEKYFPTRTTSFSELVTSDWDVFTRLVGPSPANAATADLEAALQLVEGGRPMDGEDGKHYGWAEYDVADMATRIVDTAHELARRHYFAGEYAAAEAAAGKGSTVEPANEPLWRLRIHIALASGNPGDVEQAISRMTARISELGFSLEDETEDLIEAIRDNDADTLAQHRQAL